MPNVIVPPLTGIRWITEPIEVSGTPDELSFVTLNENYYGIRIGGSLRADEATTLSDLLLRLNADAVAGNYMGARSYWSHNTVASNATLTTNTEFRLGYINGGSSPAGLNANFEIDIVNAELGVENIDVFARGYCPTAADGSTYFNWRFGGRYLVADPIQTITLLLDTGNLEDVGEYWAYQYGRYTLR